MVTAAAATRLRQSQAGVRVLVDQDLTTLWERAWAAVPDGPTQPWGVRDVLLRQVPVLVSTHGQMSAAVAADWYEAQRELAGIGGAFSVDLAPSPYMSAVEPSVRRSAGALWTATPEAGLASMKAWAGKYVLGAGRETITRAADRDPDAAGWTRVTRPGACRFCRMLADRGAVYKRATVHFASHGDCNCAAAPSWDQAAPEVDVRAYEASRRTSRMTPEQRAAHSESTRVWLDAEYADA